MRTLRLFTDEEMRVVRWLIDSVAWLPTNEMATPLDDFIAKVKEEEQLREKERRELIP